MGLTVAGMTWLSGTYCMQVPGMTVTISPVSTKCVTGTTQSMSRLPYVSCRPGTQGMTMPST